MFEVGFKLEKILKDHVTSPHRVSKLTKRVNYVNDVNRFVFELIGEV